LGVTSALKFLVMTSHPLPGPVLKTLTTFVQGLDEALQAEAHKVEQAVAVDDAFDRRYVAAVLTRSLICSIAHTLRGDALFVEELPNGGCELWNVDAAIERRFRFRRVTRDQYGLLDVRTSSDSLLAGKAREATLSLFDEPVTLPSETEQWVLAYMLEPATQTLKELSAARIIGFMNDRAPFRLKLGDVTRIALSASLPPAFQGTNDDLELPGEEDDEEGEAAS
jgi:hypothetical protein